VQAEDELNIAVEERHHDVGVLLARHAEDALDPLGLQAFDEQIRCFHGDFLPLSSGGPVVTPSRLWRRRSGGTANPQR
jgi:hypothetical protein